MKRIYVNPEDIRANDKDGGHRPVMTVLDDEKGRVRGDKVYIDGPCELVYGQEFDAESSSKVWIVTDAPVRVMFDGEEIEKC